MIELADRLDRLLQLLIVVQPAAHFSNALATNTDLARAPAWIRHRQNKYLVPFTTRALRTAPGVSNGALQQRSAQQLAVDRQLAQQLLTCAKGLITNYSKEPINREGLRQLQFRSTLQFSAPLAILRTSPTSLNFAPGSS